MHRFIDFAQKHGSTATTLRGAVRYLHSSAADQLRRWLQPTNTRTLRADWERSVAIRKADPDAKRARDDAAFRRRYLAKLRVRAAKATGWLSTDLDEIIRVVDTQQARVSEFTEVARLRSIATGKPATLDDFPVMDAIALHEMCGALVPVDPVIARLVGASIDMRGKDATLFPCLEKSYGYHSPGETQWKNGKPKHYTRATHANYVRSIARVMLPAGSTVDYICHTRRVQVTLPAGYSWHVDGNGLRAVCDESRRDDYHPCAADLLRRDAAEFIVGRLVRNRDRRQALAAQTAAEAAQVQGVYVCVADSLRAGNCSVGTRAFAARHKLDVTRHYEAPELLQLANGEANRVRLAITAARLRHEREMAAGCCVLSEHRTP